MADNAAPAAARARLLVCNCQRSMAVDGRGIATALGHDGPLAVHSELCRAGLPAFEDAIAGGVPVHVACTQEAPLFREVAAEKGTEAATLTFTNIREHAGWCAPGHSAAPKMAALLAAAMHVQTPAGLITLTSGGNCLVYGPGDVALDAARDLADRLSVTVLLTGAGDVLPPHHANLAIAKGRIRTATGRLGKFEIEVDGYAAALPSSRALLDYAVPRNGARSTCDVIVDLSGERPLFADGLRRDGYIRANPADAAAVARAQFKAADLAGEFEKPRYVAYDAGICVHARSAKIGCRKCLDNCPTGAITPAGDHVAIDAAICGGCGACSAVCPTGAVSYAYPQRGDVLTRINIMLETYRRAGGSRPVLLAHDERHGGAVIDMLARTGAGLPVNVIPLALHAAAAIGHDVLAGALALGAEQIVVLAAPEHPEEHAATQGEIGLLAAILDGLGYAGPRVHFTPAGDPDALAGLLADLPRLPPIAHERFAFAGGKRDIARTAMAKLHAAAPAPLPRLALPPGAPYGRIEIMADGCTLCLACVGACPVGALADNAERPEVAFTEAACVQCGICVATCPEKVITLAPGYDFTPAAMTPTVLKSEQPFHCVECGKPFGTRSTINRVVERLKGRHAMFQNEAQLRLIQMCDTCRIVTVSEAGNDPMRLGERPRIRTTEDYLADARAAAAKPPAKPKTPDDFLS